MLTYKNRFKKAAAGISLAAMLAVGVAAPAMAADTVTGEITGGSRSAVIANLDLAAVAYSHVDQDAGGTMVLTVNDETGTGDGWNVTVQAGDFAYGGTGTGQAAIAASNFAFNTLGAPAATAGQAVDPTDGPLFDSANHLTTLEAARRVSFANAGFGSGTYTQDLPIILTIPGTSLAGVYTSLLTVTNAAGPGGI